VSSIGTLSWSAPGEVGLRRDELLDRDAEPWSGWIGEKQVAGDKLDEYAASGRQALGEHG
jgi:hypothetical protein